MSTPQSVLWWGEGRNAAGPRYWQAAAVASDDGVSVPFVVQTNALAPAGLSGECGFIMASVTITAAAGATISVTPIIDDTEPVSVATDDSGTLSTVVTQFTFPQQMGGPPIPMYTMTVDVPLFVQLVRGGIVQSRWSPRGARCALRLQSVGAIGAGTFRVDAVDLLVDTVRATAKGTVVTT